MSQQVYPEEYKSFLVRFWSNQTSKQQHDRWCGEIEHIQSGTRWSFSTLTELLAFLEQAALPLNPAKQPGSDESFK